MNQVANNHNINSEHPTCNTTHDNSLDITKYMLLKPSNPPDITIEELLKKKNRQTLKTGNSFFIYRMAMVKQNEKYALKCDMPTLSKIASKFWSQESQQVKDHYKQLAKDAQTRFAEQCQQIQLGNPLQTTKAGRNLGFPQPQGSTIHRTRLPSISTLNPIDRYLCQKPRYNPIQANNSNLNTITNIQETNNYNQLLEQLMLHQQMMLKQQNMLERLMNYHKSRL
ncbi:12164_t:CDS:1 [Ambispora gerdemannii]|uniref:12164_t:CDS:1 n=1 Tax=Ambispora gerdemannii TaxID=144530 RepID=A0A9N9D3K2_9GLOM|nr:12164_t:CDS:1 [Ambispora gerdemannii]